MAKINKMIIGFIVLVAGIVTIIVVPGWGKWLADYPATVSQAYIATLPATTQAAAAGSLASINTVFGPIIIKAGGWVKDIGYGGGAFMALIGLFVMLGGMMKTEK